jgi:hypothetical protein
LPTDPSHVHVESGVHDVFDGFHVGRIRAAKLNVDHRVDDRTTRPRSEQDAD